VAYLRHIQTAAYVIALVWLDSNYTINLFTGLHRQVVIKVEHRLLPVSVPSFWSYKRTSDSFLFNSITTTTEINNQLM